MGAGWTSEEPAPRATRPATTRGQRASRVIFAAIGMLVGGAADIVIALLFFAPDALVAVIGYALGTTGLALFTASVYIYNGADDTPPALPRPPRDDAGAASIGGALVWCGIVLGLALAVLLPPIPVVPATAGAAGLVLTAVFWVGLRAALLRGAPAPQPVSPRRRTVVAVLAFASCLVGAYLLTSAVELKVAWDDPARLALAAAALTFLAASFRMLGVVLAWQAEVAPRLPPEADDDAGAAEVLAILLAVGIAITIFAVAAAPLSAWCPACTTTIAPSTPGARWANCELADTNTMPTCADLQPGEELVTRAGAPVCVLQRVMTANASGVHDVQVLACEAIATVQEAP